MKTFKELATIRALNYVHCTQDVNNKLNKLYCMKDTTLWDLPSGFTMTNYANNKAVTCPECLKAVNKIKLMRGE